ncbi:hypothetical protein Tco_0616242 [Tanacetum coccineum]
MDSQSTQTIKLPILQPGEYDLWKMRMEQYLQCIDYTLWEIDPRPYQKNLTMADNTQAKAITCGAIIDMGRGTLCIDDGVIRHTYFPKPRSKSYVEAFEMEGEDDWLGSFEVGRDEDGNVKYGPVAPSFIDIEDDMERALAMEAYFNPFKNVIVFKKLVDFLGSLPVQLKNLDWGNEGYGTYKKIDGDGDWHARFEIVTPSGRKFNRAFKTKTTTRKLSGKFKTEDVLREDDRAPCRAADMLCRAAREKSRKDTLPNPLIAEYERRNKRNTITYSFQPVSNANLKWKDFPSVERHAYCLGFERSFEEDDEIVSTSYEGDGDVFVDYSWERALSIDNEIYPEWVLEFFSTLYFDKDVDRTNLMKEKCIWFRLCGHEHILTLPEFAVVLGLFTEEEVEHRLFEVYFGKLEVDDKQFDYKDYWTRVGKPTLTNHKEVLMLADELDKENTCLNKETEIPTQASEGSSEPRQEHGSLNTIGGSSREAGFNDDDMDE